MQENDLILSLDPSSTCTGWALLRPGEVYVASGRLLPSRVKVEPKALEPYYRIDAMCLALRKLLDQWRPRYIIMEWTSGKRAARLGQNVSHLAIYGAAVGALWREAVHWTAYWTDQGVPAAVEGVLENDWTGGRPKRTNSKHVGRVEMAAAMFRQYDAQQDKGGDEADALMLGVWHQRELQMSELCNPERTQP
jgi:Holliday junction resolvasome RuvABC endonuclease subunit